MEGSVIFILISMVCLFCAEYIESLPLSNTPEVFGLHPNAEIGYYTTAAKEMWSHLVELQPQTGSVSLKYLMPHVFVFIEWYMYSKYLV